MPGKDYQVPDIDYAVVRQRRVDTTQKRNGLVDSKAPMGCLMVLPALDYIGRFIPFQCGLLRERLNLLWANGSVVDADVVNQS